MIFPSYPKSVFPVQYPLQCSCLPSKSPEHCPQTFTTTTPAFSLASHGEHIRHFAVRKMETRLRSSDSDIIKGRIFPQPCPSVV
ncbi:hypothetical protein IAS59_006372 [Cryptococcus gattii]